MSSFNTPIELDFKSADPTTAKIQSFANPKGFESIRTFTSYSFDKNVLVPASAFRFTAPGVDKSARKAIRSGDTVDLFVVKPDGVKSQIATGIIDETDTHITSNAVEYVLTGRDMIGQLVDNAAVDANNQIRHTAQMTLAEITRFLIRGTRIPPQFRMQGIPNGPLLFQTQPGETKINALQRYLEFCNCLVWAAPNGQVVIGKPDFTNKLGGVLKVSRSDPSGNNVIEARVRRGLNGAIRQIVTQLQSLGSVAPAPYTVLNSDRDMSRLAASQVGRSVYRTFSYGGATDIVNVIQKVGNSGSPFDIGRALSLREIARENVRVLDVELVLRGHVNPDGEPFDIDQVYDVQIEDDDVAEPMYVYGCNYSLTPDTGMLTTLRLCRLGAIVAYGEQIRRTNNNAR